MNQKIVSIKRSDDLVIIQNKGNNEVYQDTFENFAIDNGSPIPTEIDYLDRCWETGLAILNDGEVTADVEAWAVAIVEKAGELWQAQNTRLNPPPEPEPEPTEEELALEAKQQEIAEAKAYLNETDYAVIKCMELGLNLETEYPGLSAKRQEARDKVNAAEAEVATLTIAVASAKEA